MSVVDEIVQYCKDFGWTQIQQSDLIFMFVGGIFVGAGLMKLVDFILIVYNKKGGASS
ncbi:MAG TPA: hypothetical protein V6C58_04620 [Allocoleopsis sp.]